MSQRDSDATYRGGQFALMESLVEGQGVLIGQYATLKTMIDAHLKYHEEAREFRRRIWLVVLAATLTVVGGILITLWTQRRDVAEMRALVDEARQLIRQIPAQPAPGGDSLHAGDRR